MGFSGIKELAFSLFDLLYPSVCASCGIDLIGHDSPICQRCMHHLKMFTPPLCPLCGAPLSYELDPKYKRCKYCPSGKIFFDKIRSVYSYKDPCMKNLIHSLKFDYQTRLADPLSRLLLRGFERYYKQDLFDALAPIPLHKSRLREREFNQATLLCKSIAEKTHIPIREDLIVRIRRTPSQATLTPEQRMKNLEKAFRPFQENSAYGLRILVVDDVMTTGATINTASAALRAAGAKSICALTLAQTINHPSERSFSPSMENKE